MYGWFWNVLPGPTPVRILLLILIFALIVVVLFLWVFPIVDAMLPIDESEIETAGRVMAFDSLTGT